LRPADGAEAIESWKIAYENIKSPTALIFTRQNVIDLPAINGDRREEAKKTVKGAYIVHKEKREKIDVILLANGSEVGLLCNVAKELELEDLSVRVVSAVSEGLFKMQTKEYQNEILPRFKTAIFGLTAGLPDSLTSLAGAFGEVVGREKFGTSAPANVLDEKFGFTVSAVKEKVKKYLCEYEKNIALMK
jgi:transketolase